MVFLVLACVCFSAVVPADDSYIVPSDCEQLLSGGQTPLSQLTARHFQCAVHTYVGGSAERQAELDGLKAKGLRANADEIAFDSATGKLLWKTAVEDQEAFSTSGLTRAEVAATLQEIMANALETIRNLVGESDNDIIVENWEFGIEARSGPDNGSEIEQVAYRQVIARRGLLGLFCRHRNYLVVRVKVPCVASKLEGTYVQKVNTDADPPGGAGEGLAAHGSSHENTTNPPGMRIWIDSSGTRAANAAIIRVQGEYAVFRTHDGRMAAAKLSELSLRDQRYVTHWISKDDSSLEGHSGDELAASRVWRDSTGQYTCQATLARVEHDHVYLLRNDGPVVRVALNRLSSQDRQLIADRLTNEHLASRF